jgi:hypothetical protein
LDCVTVIIGTYACSVSTLREPCDIEGDWEDERRRYKLRHVDTFMPFSVDVEHFFVCHFV